MAHDWEADADGAPRNQFDFTRQEYDALVARMPRDSRQLSRRSEYEEIELVEDCTLYDIYRQPRAPVTDPEATKTLAVRVLNADLTCPICLGIIRHTMVVMECLHRFCGDCIQKCLRISNKECPSCRIHIPSKRSLRPDLNFDALIAKIYPDLDEFEKKEDHLIEEINRSRHFHNALTESTKMGVRNQASIRRQNKKKRSTSTPSRSSSPSPPPSASDSPPTVGDKRTAAGSTARLSKSPPSAPTPDDSSNHTSSSSSSADDESESPRKKARAASSGSGESSAANKAKPSTQTAPSERVNLRVVLHPDEDASSPKLQRTLFSTSYRLKICMLKKHLANLLKLKSTSNMRIVLSVENCALSGLSAAVASAKSSGAVIRKDLLFDQELEDCISIFDIYQQYGMGTKWELRLLYHFSDAIVNGVAQFVSSEMR